VIIKAYGEVVMTVVWKSNRFFGTLVGIVLLGAYGTVGLQAIFAQSDLLHAGLRVNLAQPAPTGKPDRVQLTFALINDSEKVVSADKSEWKLIIDGSEVDEFRLGVGVGASADDNSLAPGQWYEFTRFLFLSDYFPHGGKHTAQWTGDGFRSPKISFSIPSDHAGQ
jgi:hypothetical protein